MSSRRRFVRRKRVENPTPLGQSLRVTSAYGVAIVDDPLKDSPMLIVRNPEEAALHRALYGAPIEVDGSSVAVRI